MSQFLSLGVVNSTQINNQRPCLIPNSFRTAYRKYKKEVQRSINTAQGNNELLKRKTAI